MCVGRGLWALKGGPQSREVLSLEIKDNLVRIIVFIVKLFRTIANVEVTSVLLLLLVIPATSPFLSFP